MSEDKKASRRAFVSTRRANGPAIRYYRESAYLTLEELAEMSGISYPQISRIERGESVSPRKSTLRQLAKALGRSVDEIVIYDDPTQNVPRTDEELKNEADFEARIHDRHAEGDDSGERGD